MWVVGGLRDVERRQGNAVRDGKNGGDGVGRGWGAGVGEGVGMPLLRVGGEEGTGGRKQGVGCGVNRKTTVAV